MPLQPIGRRIACDWFASTDARPYLRFRRIFGIYLCFYFLRFAPDVEVLFSNQGVNVPFLVPDIALPPLGAWLAYLATLGLTMAFALGFRPAAIGPMTLAAYLYHYFVQFGASSYSYDRMNLIVIAIVCIGDIAVVNAPLAPGRCLAWAPRLLRFELAAMYFGSGLYKLLNPAWHDGRLIEMTLQGDWATATGFALVQAGLPAWAFDSAAFGVIAFELAIGPALYIPRTRFAAAVAGTVFHGVNWFLLGIPEFLSCVALYALFFEPPGRPHESGDARRQSRCASHLSLEQNERRGCPASC